MGTDWLRFWDIFFVREKVPSTFPRTTFTGFQRDRISQQKQRWISRPASYQSMESSVGVKTSLFFFWGGEGFKVGDWFPGMVPSRILILVKPASVFFRLDGLRAQPVTTLGFKNVFYLGDTRWAPEPIVINGLMGPP